MAMWGGDSPRPHCEIPISMAFASRGGHWYPRATRDIIPPNSPCHHSIEVIQDFRVPLHRDSPVIVNPMLEVMVDSVEHFVGEAASIL